MNTAQIIEELERQKASLETALAALNGTGPKMRKRKGKRKPLSADARKRISAAQKKRWAERKKTKA